MDNHGTLLKGVMSHPGTGEAQGSTRVSGVTPRFDPPGLTKAEQGRFSQRRSLEPSLETFCRGQEDALLNLQSSKLRIKRTINTKWL